MLRRGGWQTKQNTGIPMCGTTDEVDGELGHAAAAGAFQYKFKKN